MREAHTRRVRRDAIFYTIFQHSPELIFEFIEPKNTTIHQPQLESDKVRRIYLDELDNSAEQSIGISLMQLTIASENKVVESAKRLIERVKQEESRILPQKSLLDIITTISSRAKLI